LRDRLGKLLREGRSAAAVAALVPFAADVEGFFDHDETDSFATAELVAWIEEVAFEVAELTDCASSTSEAVSVTAVVGAIAVTVCKFVGKAK
jgi:hypothetical protein